MTRFRKGQRVKIAWDNMTGIGVVESTFRNTKDILVYMPSYYRGGHGRDNICRWFDRRELKEVCVPRTKIDKLINAYCEAEFKQLGIQR